MLATNYEEGDERIVESLLALELDEVTYHSLCLSVRHFFERHETAEATHALTLLYENGPCSLCRNACVELLIARGVLPDWMREECHSDSDPGTRKLVE